jgi:hypothetical protein
VPRSNRLRLPDNTRQRGRLRVDPHKQVADPLHPGLDTASQQSRRRSLSEPSLPNVLGFSCKGPSPSTPIDQKKGGQPQAASIRRSQSTQPFGGPCQLQT